MTQTNSPKLAVKILTEIQKRITPPHRLPPPPPPKKDRFSQLVLSRQSKRICPADIFLSKMADGKYLMKGKNAVSFFNLTAELFALIFLEVTRTKD